MSKAIILTAAFLGIVIGASFGSLVQQHMDDTEHRALNVKLGCGGYSVTTGAYEDIQAPKALMLDALEMPNDTIMQAATHAVTPKHKPKQ